jgi:hypothetical protein
MQWYVKTQINLDTLIPAACMKWLSQRFDNTHYFS